MREIPAEVATLLKSRAMIGDNKPTCEVIIGTPESNHPSEVPEGYTGVYTAEDLNNVRNDLTAKYIQMADIDLSDYDPWIPIGGYGLQSQFKGSYIGGNYNITNMHISPELTDSTIGNMGLFGHLDTLSPNRLADIHIVGATVNITDEVRVYSADTVGLLAGYSTGQLVMNNCHVSGTITINNNSGKYNYMSNIGGLIGELDTYDDAIVSDCSANCIIENVGENNTNYNCGLFIGRLFADGGIISDCYSRGALTGDEYCGLFIGKIDKVGNIERCYTEGTLSMQSGWSGGFAGKLNQCTLAQDCYAITHIVQLPTTDDSVDGYGGFAGDYSNSVVKNCYTVVTFENLSEATIEISAFSPYTGGITDSYFDSSVTELVDDSATGKTTAEMKTQSTFVGWDFNAVWILDAENNGYPHFKIPSRKTIPVKSIGISRNKGMAGSLDLSLDNKNGEWAPDGTEHPKLLMPNKQVTVKQGYGSNLVTTFTGYIDTVSMTTFPAELQISCRDKSKLALDRIVTNNVDGGHYVKYTAKTVGHMVENLASLCGLEVGTIDPTGITLESKMFSWESYADAFSWLADLVSFEWRVDEQGYLYFTKDEMPAEPAVAYSFAEGEDIISLGYTISDADLYYQAVVYGQDADQRVIKETANFGAPLTYNLFSQKVLKIDASEADTEAKCQEIADRAVALMLCRARVVDFAAVAVPWLQIGDFIQVTESSTTVSEIYRITDLSSTQNDSGFTMQITCYWYGGVAE